MNTILIILGILAIGAAVYFYFYKTGKINDRDGDYIPDEVEDPFFQRWKENQKQYRQEIHDNFHHQHL